MRGLFHFYPFAFSTANLRFLFHLYKFLGYSAFQCLDRADLRTVLTQNTFCRILALTGVVTNLYIHRARFQTFAALDALALITMNT